MTTTFSSKMIPTSSMDLFSRDIVNIAEAFAQEQVLFYTLLPSYVLGLIGCITVISIIMCKSRLWKPRHIFQALSLSCSMVGVFVGVYGLIFVISRLDSTLALEEKWFYLFVWHRYLLLFGDMLPSLDRGFAIVKPIKYYTLATPGAAVGICIGVFFCALLLTLVTFLWGLVPENLEMSPFPLFHLLVTDKFVYLLSVPYVILAVVVLVCDLWALQIAIRRRSRLIKEKARVPTQTTSSSADNKTKREGSRSSNCSLPFTKTDSVSIARKVIQIKISIRCLATTMWFFSSQMCTFLPGIFLLGCQNIDWAKDTSLGETVNLNATSSTTPMSSTTTISFENPEKTCDKVLTLWIRIFMYCFYQFQFFKPIFFLMMDSHLREAVFKTFKCCGKNKDLEKLIHKKMATAPPADIEQQQA